MVFVRGTLVMLGTHSMLIILWYTICLQRARVWRLLCWNVCGLNADARHNKESQASIICIQDTKHEYIYQWFIRKFFPKRFDYFAYSPSKGASGACCCCGILPFSYVASAAMLKAVPTKEGLSLANRIVCNVIHTRWIWLHGNYEACTEEEPWWNESSTIFYRLCGPGVVSWMWNESSTIFADCVDMVLLVGCVTFKHSPR